MTQGGGGGWAKLGCWIFAARADVLNQVSRSRDCLAVFFLSITTFCRLEFFLLYLMPGRHFFNHHYHTWDDVVISIFKVAGA
jgi:hypothetical protein